MAPTVTTLHLTNSYHAASGGIRTFYHALLDAAAGAGRRVVLVVPGKSAAREDLGPNATIYWVPAPLAPAFDRRYRVIQPRAYFPWSQSPIARILRHERPQLVEIADKFSLPYLAAMLRKHWFRGIRRPTLVGLSCERFDDSVRAFLSTHAAAAKLARRYIRHIYGPPFDVHFAVSGFTAAELREAMPDRRPDFVRVMPMGVDCSMFGRDRGSRAERLELLTRAGGTSESVLLLYAGRISPEKNIQLLPAMLRELLADGRDYRLLIAGSGPGSARLFAGLEPQIASRIYFEGQADRERLARLYASADVFVHPNPREPFGIGPLEAMASGVPVVVPAAGGVLEYANRQNAWLASPTPVAFADAVRDAVIGDPDRIRAARETTEAFAWRAATRRYFAEYDRVIALHHRFSRGSVADVSGA